MTHASLFSGIGAPDLAAQWMGWQNVFHCEINPFGRKISNYYWPDSISYENIITTDFSIHRGTVDVLTGGFPCQPYSLAGLRKGKDDERHLWPQMLRAIREVKPRWIVGENVLGLVNWNDGLVFEEVQTDLEAEGYEVQPYVLPAAGVGAPHQRYRVWFVAFNSKCKSNVRGNSGASSRDGLDLVGSLMGTSRRKQGSNDFKPSSSPRITSDTTSNGYESWGPGKDRRAASKSSSIRDQRERFWNDNRGTSEQGTITDTTGQRREEREQNRGRENSKETRTGLEFRSERFSNNGNATDANGFRLRRQGDWSGESRQFGKESEGNYWENFPTQSPICNGDDGISSRLDSTSLLNGKQPRQPWQAFGKWRNETIKAGGNAIVPQVIHQIFKAIYEYEKEVE